MVVLIAKLKGILFGRYVWITNTVSGGILLSVGDFIQQNIEHKENPKRKQQQKYDLERSGHMMIVGLGLGWTHNFWYTFLDRVLPGAALMTVAKKVILDQTISSPFSNWFFFMGCGLLEGNTAKSSWEEFTDKFAMVYKVLTFLSFQIFIFKCLKNDHSSYDYHSSISSVPITIIHSVSYQISKL